MNPGLWAHLALKEPLKSSVNYYVPSVVTQGHRAGQMRSATVLTLSLHAPLNSPTVSKKDQLSFGWKIDFSVTRTSIQLFTYDFQDNHVYNIQLGEHNQHLHRHIQLMVGYFT